MNSCLIEKRPDSDSEKCCSGALKSLDCCFTKLQDPDCLVVGSGQCLSHQNLEYSIYKMLGAGSRDPLYTFSSVSNLSNSLNTESSFCILRAHGSCPYLLQIKVYTCFNHAFSWWKITPLSVKVTECAMKVYPVNCYFREDKDSDIWTKTPGQPQTVTSVRSPSAQLYVSVCNPVILASANIITCSQKRFWI